ncbi:hypothetical protein V1279_006168 [Bradyrhizobium sp. AZCC 1610]
MSKRLVLSAPADLVDFRLLMARHPAETIAAEARRRAQENR